MPLFVKAPGKLVIFGEYAVLHGAPAVATSVSRGLRVRITPRNQGSRLTMPHLGFADVPLTKLRDEGISAAGALSPNAGHQVRAVLDIIDRFNEHVHYGRVTPPHVDIAVDARELYHRGIKLGLGSSAALTVALITGLQAHLSGRRPERQTLFKLAFRIHQHLQGGRGSGLDVAASVYGGYCRYRLPEGRRDATPEVGALNWPDSIHALAVWTGQPASTAGLLHELDRWRARHADRYQSIMDALIQVAQNGVETLINGDASGFIDTIEGRLNWEIELDPGEQMTGPLELFGGGIVNEKSSRVGNG